MFRDNLCQLRKLNGLSQEELAENEISMIREIEAIWKTASPSKQALALAMLKAVLEYEEP